MEFSLVVASKDRPKELNRLLESLLPSCKYLREVIIVDQSLLESESVKQVSLSKSDILNVVFIRDSGNGPSSARNKGIKFATGDIICFPDDDCWYSSRFFENLSEAFELNPGYQLISGIYNDNESHNPNFYHEKSDISRSSFYGKATAITIFIRREYLKKCRFDENLGTGFLPAAEEIDFLFKLLDTGVRMLFDPSIIVNHAVKRTNSMDLKIVSRRKRADTYVFVKHNHNTKSFIVKFFKFIFNSAIRNRDLKSSMTILPQCFVGAVYYFVKDRK